MITGTEVKVVVNLSDTEAVSYRTGLQSAINNCSFASKEALYKYCQKTYGKFPSELSGSDLFDMYHFACNVNTNDRKLGISLPVFGDLPANQAATALNAS